MSQDLLLTIVLILWVGSEIAVTIAKRAGGKSSHHDRGSLAILWLVIAISTTAAVMTRDVPATRIAPTETAFLIGVTLIIAGIVVRGIAIMTLRRYFTVNVAIREGHELIDRGLYGVIRHPSYSGSLLSFVGLGLALGNWLSVVASIVGPLLALSYRIAVEERALTDHFGDRYREYAQRTKRLIPFVY